MSNLLKAFVIPSTPFSLRRQYMTDVITSRKGKEHRRALRTVPRRHAEFTTTLTGSRRLDFSRFMNSGQRQAIMIADETRKVPIVLSSSGATTTFTATPNWLADGMNVVLADFVGGFYSHGVVASHTSTTASLTGVDAHTWPIGSTVYAGMIGYLAPTTSYNALAFNIVSPQIVFDEDPQYYIAEPSVTSMGTFNSREVWTFPPNKFVSVSAEFDAQMEMVDFGLGSFQTYDIWQRTHRLFTGTWIMREGDADTIRAMFDRMRGQQGEFYMPTWEYDLTPTALTTAGTNTLLIAGRDVYDQFNGSTLYKAACVFYNANRYPTMQFNQVTSIALSSGNSLITFADNWTADVTTSMQISWAPVWRFATDILEFSWLRGLNNQTAVNLQMSFKMLEDLTPEVDTP